MDEDGFFVGEMNGQLGLVPSNFLEDAPPNLNYPPPAHAPGRRQGDRERERRDRSREYGDRDRERDRDRDRDRRGSHDPRDSRDSRDPRDRRDRDRDRSREYGDPRDRGRERGDMRDHRDHRDRDGSRGHGDHGDPRSREPSDSRDRSRDMDHSRDRDRHREYDRDRERDRERDRDRDRDRDRHRRVSREREHHDGQSSGPSSAYGAYPNKTTLSNEHRGSNQAGRRMRDEGGPGVGADTPPENQPSRTTNPPNSIKTDDKDPQVRVPLQRPKGASLSGRKPQPTHSKT